MTKLAVIYYSATGHGTTMAQVIGAAAEELGAEVRVRHIAETVDPSVFDGNPAWKANYEATANLPAATGDDIVWADAVIFGSPTRFSNVAAPFQAFLDGLGGLWSQGKLADKVYAAYTSSQTLHGGQETTLQKIYQVVMHFGGIVVAPGFTDGSKFVDGNPYGVSHVTGPDNKQQIDETTITALQHLTTRVITLAAKLTA
ncbi:NAD(P)H:quinone oxidoreductase [Williamsia sterculiae]|uniref:NAD(P)H dehydrogenase (Quinone) n=1 Tax=Williamsia sterculiae TaxID=1344003 RepID=A0A1N7CDP0_9NOCA|nr:NAD(P)H:quinone oxidoreductase [Williamsia sterculiae]SIR61771.1 NAD(P)H dehydrogenase (quinone) [Williamsia sterculiae]